MGTLSLGRGKFKTEVVSGSMDWGGAIHNILELWVATMRVSQEYFLPGKSDQGTLPQTVNLLHAFYNSPIGLNTVTNTVTDATDTAALATKNMSMAVAKLEHDFQMVNATECFPQFQALP